MGEKSIVGKQRLQKILSAFGVASRREAERLIQDGRVCVNDSVAVLGQSALCGVDRITVDGVPLACKEQFVYIMMNKPRGYLTTMTDDRGRSTVMELLQDINIRVYPIGRLDLNTEGLLLFTNDGEFANSVAHPSFNKTKTYQVRVRGNASEAVQLLTKPIEVDGRMVRAVKAELISESAKGGVLEITINEGRNRQIRKMCAQTGVVVLKLKRISIGELKLGTLETGKWRYLTTKEVKAFGK